MRDGCNGGRICHPMLHRLPSTILKEVAIAGGSGKALSSTCYWNLLQDLATEKSPTGSEGVVSKDNNKYVVDLWRYCWEAYGLTFFFGSSVRHRCLALLAIVNYLIIMYIYLCRRWSLSSFWKHNLLTLGVRNHQVHLVVDKHATYIEKITLINSSNPLSIFFNICNKSG